MNPIQNQWRGRRLAGLTFTNNHQLGSQNLGRRIGGRQTRRDGTTELQIAACKVLRGEVERPLPGLNLPFEVRFSRSVEIHERACVLQLYNQGMVATNQFRPRFDGGMQTLTGSTRSFCTSRFIKCHIKVGRPTSWFMRRVSLKGR